MFFDMRFIQALPSLTLHRRIEWAICWAISSLPLLGDAGSFDGAEVRLSLEAVAFEDKT